MTTVLSRVAALTHKHPIIRGMVSYAALWPTSCLIQETIAGKSWKNYDWLRALRFSLYGSLFVAPTFYAWIKLASVIWPKTCLRTAITKALAEQVCYAPFTLFCFFFGMSLLEGKSVDEASNEVAEKFIPTFKVGVCFWPFIQTVNFYFIPERNRVPFVSVCSLVWCCFLAYMHQLKIKNEKVIVQSVK